MISNMIQIQFGKANNAPLGAAPGDHFNGDCRLDQPGDLHGRTMVPGEGHHEVHADFLSELVADIRVALRVLSLCARRAAAAVRL